MKKRLLREPELMEYLGVGRATARRFGTEAGALVRFGRRIAYDVQAIDKAIEEQKKADQAERNARPASSGECNCPNIILRVSPSKIKKG